MRRPLLPLLLAALTALLAGAASAADAPLPGLNPFSAEFPAEETGGRVSLDAVMYEGVLVPGRESNLGILIDIQDGWHIQAGEGSGDEKPPYIATTIEVEGPDGWTTRPARWPAATNFTLGEGEFSETLAGYEDRILAIVPVHVPASAAPGDYRLHVTVGYQACDDMQCEAPTSAPFTAVVTVADAPDADASPLDESLSRLFQDVFSRQPQVAHSGEPDASAAEHARFRMADLHWWVALLFVLLAMGWMFGRTLAISKSVVTKTIVALVAAGVSFLAVAFVHGMTSPPGFDWVSYDDNAALIEQAIASREKTVVAKFTAAWCANCHVNERIIMGSEEAVAALNRPDVLPVKVDLTSNDSPGWGWLRSLGSGGIPLIAVFSPGAEQPVRIAGPITSARPVLDAMSGALAGGDEDRVVFDFLGAYFTVHKDALWIILGLAFIAGFFMNFTPCVLPVVPLKILSLQAHAKNPARCFGLGVVFGLGIIAFYALLGLLMAGLLFTTERMDWGELWGHWWLAGAVGVVVGAMALGMLGLFSIRLPQVLYVFNPQSDTIGGSFFMGVFTAILSTPCTGPLLGATVAWLLLQPASVALLTLIVMGAGMAFPYVLLTAKPTWLARLPRTGPGSELVKQVMGLLLLAVAAFFIGIAIPGLTS